MVRTVQGGTSGGVSGGGPDRSLEVLEYPKVLVLVAQDAVTALGKERVGAMRPGCDVGTAAVLQAETREGERVLRTTPYPPVGPAEDIRPLVERALRESVLTGSELRVVAQVPAAARRMRDLLTDFGVPEAPLTALRAYAERLIPLTALERRILDAITEGGEVADAASPVLARLRGQARRLTQQIRDRLEQIVRAPDTARHLMEPIVTLRQGRYVVPVRADARRFVPGLVHDTSQSGQTLFVEPIAVLELGNELRAVEAQAREEEERILRELTGLVAQSASLLREDAAVLGELDAIFARGRARDRWDGTYPELVALPRLALRRARHPLLGPTAVPIDVEIGRTFWSLVISGPNTGGKTVTLKTMGLLTAMALSGLSVPADEASEVGAFARILADIGDEQSIEQSLSTFSSHLSHIVEFLQTADDRSLVLLDELGAGTDPTEGAALGRAILQTLHERRARTAVTTHLSDLKRHATETPGMENGSVAFDVATLRPTYRFELGVPGESNAFAIARRLGVPREVIEAARAYLTPEAARVEDLMRSVGEARRALAEEEAHVSALSRALEAERAALAAERRALEARRAELLAKAREDARALVAQARRESEAAIAALRSAMQGEARPETAIEAARQALRRAAGLEVAEEAGELGEGVPPSRLYAGQRVRLRDMGQEATVLEPPGPDGKVTVQVGHLRLRVERDALLQAAPQAAGRERVGAGRDHAPAVRLSLERTRTARPELDLRGMRADEAEAALRSWLDDALLSGLPQGRVIHGKGTGALREMVQRVLREGTPTWTVRLGGPGEGGDGVTVVHFETP